MAKARRRFKAAEARKALVDAGVKMLRNEGLAVGLEHVRLADAIERSGVPQATAYRIWSTDADEKPQDLFREAVLIATLEIGVSPETIDSTTDVIVDLPDKNEEALESGDEIRIAQAFREVVRMASTVSITSLVDSTHWYVSLASHAAERMGDGVSQSVSEALIDGRDRDLEISTDLYQQMFDTFGVRPKPAYDLKFFAVSVSAIVQGFALRWEDDRGLDRVQRPTGPNQEMQDWSALGIALEALIIATTEPDPQAVVSADLSTWT